MVTLKNREPAHYDELPWYFTTRRAAQEWVDDREGWKAIGEWPWCDGDSLTVAPAPDDVRYDDVEWGALL